MNREDELTRALILCYGTVPKGWAKHYYEILSVIAKIPPMSTGKQLPISTYFLYLFSKASLAQLVYLNAVIGDSVVNDFMLAYGEMENAANTLAIVDDSNFRAEVTAFNDIMAAITHPHLAVSPLYRYMAAVQQNYDVLITEDMFEAAKEELRKNPYLFTAYGKDYEQLMPLKWEEL